MKSVQYLGFRLDEYGVHPTEDKVRAIKEAAIPKNRNELEAFLGLVNFYDRFLPEKLTVLAPSTNY